MKRCYMWDKEDIIEEISSIMRDIGEYLCDDGSVDGDDDYMEYRDFSKLVGKIIKEEMQNV